MNLEKKITALAFCFLIPCFLYSVALEHLEYKVEKISTTSKGNTEKAKEILMGDFISKLEINITSSIDKKIFNRDTVAIDYYLNKYNEQNTEVLLESYLAKL